MLIKKNIVTLCSGNSLYFNIYELSNKNCKDDIKRLQSKGAYKMVQKYENPEAHSIVSYTLHNDLKSHLCILGCSNKELIVYDVNYNKEVSSTFDSEGNQITSGFPDLHDKMIHTLEFFKGNNRDDPNCYNLFMTSSTDNFIRVWDIRSCQPVREFNSHVNRGNPIGCGISNCLRYLITGSEDRAVYIYDLGQGKLLEKTKNSDHLDSVCDISINPNYYEWATGSYDGHVRVYRHPSKKKKATTKNYGGGGMRTSSAAQKAPKQRTSHQATRVMDRDAW